MRTTLGIFAGLGILLILVTILFGEPVDKTTDRRAPPVQSAQTLLERTDEEAPASALVSFDGTGNIVRGNPGMEPGTWYLVYDEPGRPGVSVALQFASSSTCVVAGTTTPCTTYVFEQGQRVRVVGIREGASIDVLRVEDVNVAFPRATGSPALAE